MDTISKSQTPPNPIETFLSDTDAISAKPPRKLTSIEDARDILTLPYRRDNTSIRKSYIAKLISHGLMNSNRKSHNALIIFDWDDTLMCTSYLTPNGYLDETVALSKRTSVKITALERCVQNLLSISLDKGDVYIVTNAEEGWVEYSTERFFPTVLPLLKRIKVISARAMCESAFPNDVAKWKVEAFKSIVNKFDNDRITNIICVGDSFNELNAGKKVAKTFKNACIKTIKFKQNPNIDDLKMQLNLVIDKFDYIYTTVKNWTITVERKAHKKNTM